MSTHSEKKETTQLPKVETARERAVVTEIRTIQHDLLKKLAEKYGERKGWRLCGPASIILSRILSSKLDIPLGKNLEGEHLELAIGIYDPKEDPDRLSKIEEQTYILYFTGDGHVYYIDVIYDLLMNGTDIESTAILIEKFPVNELEKALEAKYSLHTFTPSHPDLKACSTFATFSTEEEIKTYYLDSISAINDDRATLRNYVADSGKSVETDYGATGDVISTFSPNWNPNLELQSRELSKVAKKASNLGRWYHDQSSDSEHNPSTQEPSIADVVNANQGTWPAALSGIDLSGLFGTKTTDENPDKK